MVRPGLPAVHEISSNRLAVMPKQMHLALDVSWTQVESAWLAETADRFIWAALQWRLSIVLLIIVVSPRRSRAHRFNTTLAGSGGTPFAALAKQEGVSPSYFTRLVRLSYLAPDITQAILDGRQPSHLTADKLLAHSRLPLAWQDQRTLLGFA